MQAWNQRFLASTVLAVALAAAGGCNTEQGREETAASEFRQRLARNQVNLIYEGSSSALRAKTTEQEFRKSLSQTQVMGVLQHTERAHYARTPVPGEPDLVVAFYNSRFTKGNCLESFSWRMEPAGLTLASYSCAPNMQVTCTGGRAGSQCETSPVPQPGFAGAP
jgi:hypothetical protein